MLIFAATVFFLMITPGPGVLSLAGVGAAFGSRPGFTYMLGLFIGTNAVALVVVTGLAAALLSAPGVRTILSIACTAYLFYLAAKIALAGSKLAFIEAHKAPGVADGVLLQFLNPKAYAVNTLFFAGFPIWPDHFGFELAVKFVVVNAIWITIHCLWLGAGITVQRMNLAPTTQRVVNIVMALLMLAAVALATYSVVEI